MSISASATSATTPASSPPRQSPRPPSRPRMWLVAGGHVPDPDDLPTVRDNLMHTWCPGADGLMHMAVNGHDHHASWQELRARYDLVEVA